MRLMATRTNILNAGGDLGDQVYVKNHFFDALKKNKAIKIGKYGKGVEFDLLTESSGNSKWMNRYEKYTVSGRPEGRPVVFELKKLGTTAQIDKDSINENSSDEKIWDVVEEASKDSLADITRTLETALHNTGTDTKAILGLRAIVADDPTSNPTAYNVGGLSRTNSYWRNQYNTSAGLGATVNFSVDGRAALRSLWTICVRNAPKSAAGTDAEPSLIYCDWDVYNLYQGIHDANDLHVRKDDKVGSGFRSLVYMLNVPIIPGDNANIDGRLYMLNLNKDSKGNPFFGFYIDSMSNFDLGEWIMPADQPVHLQQIDLRGVFGGPFMKVHGVMYGIS